jgi:hypothetical protein
VGDGIPVECHIRGMDMSWLDHAEHWLARAEEARILASEMTDARTRATMLDIAKGYDKMAEHAWARVARSKGTTAPRPGNA